MIKPLLVHPHISDSFLFLILIHENLFKNKFFFCSIKNYYYNNYNCEKIDKLSYTVQKIITIKLKHSKN